MADSIKILAQLAPSATTLTDFYVVPTGATTTISSLYVANRSASDAYFRVSVAFTGATDSTKQYLYYDTNIPPNETFVATVGITMGATDIMRVYSSNINLSFNLFGLELI